MENESMHLTPRTLFVSRITPLTPAWLRVRLTLLTSIMMLAVGCSVPWKVVRESGPPSALAGAGAAALQFDYSTLLVEGMTQEAWVEQQKAKDPEYEKSWTDLKARFEKYYVQGFQAGWGTATVLEPGAAKPSGTVLVLVKVNTLDMGHYIPFATTRSQVTVNVVWDVAGPEDEITIAGSDTPTLTNPSIFQHVGHIGQYLGKVSAKFLSSKQ